MQEIKRQNRGSMFSGSDSSVSDEITERLQTIGMRIRQSVSMGYKVPDSSTCGLPSYMNDYEQQQSINNTRRIPLPSHLDGSTPPALDYNGSTASSLAGWEQEINSSITDNMHNINKYYNVTPHNEPSCLKRGFANVEGKELDVGDYVQRYGPLSFNDEF